MRTVRYSFRDGEVQDALTDLEELVSDEFGAGDRVEMVVTLDIAAPPRMGTAVPRPVRQAVRYLEEHHAEPIGVAALAARVHVSARSLHDQFQRTMGTTPMRHLEKIRLEACWTSLVDAEARSTSVAAVATAHGFRHLGRFAAAYRARFGEPPAATLRRDPDESGAGRLPEEPGALEDRPS